MSPSSKTTRPFRLSGRATALLLVALLGLPAGSAARAAPLRGENGSGSPLISDADHRTGLGRPIERWPSFGLRLSVPAEPGYRSRRPAESGRGSWTWPISPPHPIVGPFVAPATRFAAGHRGVDIAAAVGTTVLAPDNGVVHFVGVVVDRPVLSIQHSDGIITSFEPIDSPLREGQPVVRGEAIGVLRAGHRATPSLHLGVRVHGEYVSPLRFLGGIRASVLLPTRPL